MEQKTLQPKKSMMRLISLSALAVLLIMTAFTLFFWRNIATQAESYAHTALTAQITGYLGEKITFEEIVFSPTGQVSLTGVKVYSQNGLLLARLPVVDVYYNWHWQRFSLEAFNFKDLACIERLHLKDSEFFVSKEDAQFDLIPLLKTQSDGKPPEFAGLLEFERARIDLTRAWSFNTDIIIEEVDGTIDFKNPDDITINLTGNFELTPLKVSGNYSPQTGEIVLKNSIPIDFKAVNFERIFPAAKTVLFQDLHLERVAFSAALQKNAGAWEFKADGEFSGLTMAAPLAISAGRGNFTLAQEKITFTNLAFECFGQQAGGSGELSLNGGDVSASALNFSLAVQNVDPILISDKLAGENHLQIDAAISGSFQKPAVAGKFSMLRLNLDNIPIENISGQFNYDGGSTFLQEIKGDSLGGKIIANGELFLANRTCELDIAGYGLDSFITLGKEFKGALDFKAHLSSRPQNTITKGNFIIRNGYAYGAAFQVFNGFFVKQDGKSDISDIAIKTKTGSIYPGTLSPQALKGS